MSKKMHVIDFDINFFTEGWKTFSLIMHEFYKQKPFGLDSVCPSCKKHDYDPTWGVYNEGQVCPKCHSNLTPFWSTERAKYYFNQQDFGGILLLDKQLKEEVVAGWCIGFRDRTNPNLFYIDMLVVMPSYRFDRSLSEKVKRMAYVVLGRLYPYSRIISKLMFIAMEPNAVGLLCYCTIDRAYKKGFLGMKSRTINGFTKIERLYRGFGFKETCPCPLDNHRTIWVRKF